MHSPAFQGPAEALMIDIPEERVVRYRTFGRTGWKVSEIAFGGWQLGGDWGTVDDDASIKTLLHAYEWGINLVDTAEFVHHELDWLDTLNALRLKGKIDQIGVSVRDYRPDEGVDLAKLGLVASIQVVLNLFEQRPAGALFRSGTETDTAFIGRVPLDSGSLVGNWSEQTYAQWEPGSVPHTLFRGDRFHETLRRTRRLAELCSPYYSTLAEAAMRFALSSPEVSAVIPGMKSPAEVDLNTAYSDGAEFPELLKEQLAAYSWPRNFYA
jgi:aryl-alcohol dehydrogenase-like predicted oxidoreductase